MTQFTIKHQLKKGEQQSTKWCNQQLTQNTSKQGTPSEWESEPPHMRIEPSSKCINQGSICFAPANIPDRPILPRTVKRCQDATRPPKPTVDLAGFDSTAQDTSRSGFFMHPSCMWSFLCTLHREACSASASASPWLGEAAETDQLGENMSEFKSMAPKYCAVIGKMFFFFWEVFGVSHEHWPTVSLSCTRHPLALGQAARWPARWNQKSPWVAFFLWCHWLCPSWSQIGWKTTEDIWNQPYHQFCWQSGTFFAVYNGKTQHFDWIWTFKPGDHMIGHQLASLFWISCFETDLIRIFLATPLTILWTPPKNMGIIRFSRPNPWLLRTWSWDQDFEPPEPRNSLSIWRFEWENPSVPSGNLT